MRRVPNISRSWRRGPFDGLADLVAWLPDWVLSGWIVLFLNAVAWLPIGAAWLILESLGGLR